MHNQGRLPGSLILRTLLAVTLPAAMALAADGVIEIDQARALAGGVVAADEPGFPVTLGAPGSYILTGNLKVDDPDMTAIEIPVSNVNLNLNGFTVQGPARCASGIGSGGITCGPKGEKGYGIAIAAPDGSPPILGGSVRNGTVRGSGSSGIFVSGLAVTISNVTVVENARDGIRHDRGETLTVRDSTIVSNLEVGITILGGVAENNVVSRNGLFGIIAEGSSVLRNTVSYNKLSGIVALRREGDNVKGNFVRDNMISNNGNPQLDMTGGGAWGGNSLSGPAEFGGIEPIVRLPPRPVGDGLGPGSVSVHEQSPNTCNGQPCTVTGHGGGQDPLQPGFLP